MGVTYRTAGPEDAVAVRAFIEGLSDESRWLRYHSPVPVVRPWMVEAVVSNDHVHREALIAVHDGRVVGLAEWGRVEIGQRTADVAIVVDERCRRRGVARELLRRLAANARTHGVDEFAASVLGVNRPTINLIEHITPCRTTSFDGPTVQVRIPIARTG